MTATLHDTNNDPLANALVNVTATNVNGDGQVLIDGDRSSETTNGSAAYTVATDANGVAQFSVSGSEPGAIDVVVELRVPADRQGDDSGHRGGQGRDEGPGTRVDRQALGARRAASTSWCARPSSNGGVGDHVVPVLDLRRFEVDRALARFDVDHRDAHSPRESRIA